jgi:SAM-dependent methyltransferase
MKTTLNEHTDYAALWRELVKRSNQRKEKTGGDIKYWDHHARNYDARVRRRWQQPDSIRGFIADCIEPGASVLDIGAGTGAWAVFLASRVRYVTALEPSSGMRTIMRSNLDELGITNIKMMAGRWPETEASPHDYVLCAHAMYGAPDLPVFVNRMTATAHKTCFMLIRDSHPDSIMAQAARRILGQPNDSPNFTVAVKVLEQMGIEHETLADNHNNWKPWRHPTLEDALNEIKQRLGVDLDNQFDPYLRDLLVKNLRREEGEYIWPSGVRSALIYWQA